MLDLNGSYPRMCWHHPYRHLLLYFSKISKQLLGKQKLIAVKAYFYVYSHSHFDPHTWYSQQAASRAEISTPVPGLLTPNVSHILVGMADSPIDLFQFEVPSLLITQQETQRKYETSSKGRGWDSEALEDRYLLPLRHIFFALCVYWFVAFFSDLFWFVNDVDSKT